MKASVSIIVLASGVGLWVLFYALTNSGQSKKLSEDSDNHASAPSPSASIGSISEDAVPSDVKVWIEKENALNIAMNYVHEEGGDDKYDKNRAPGIYETVNTVEVTFWRKTNPFKNQRDFFAVKVNVDRKTGEVTSVLFPSDGGDSKYVFRLSPSLDELSLEERQVYQQRLFDVFSSLDELALKTGELPDVSSSVKHAVSKEEAIEIASSVEKRKAYDEESPPHVSLVDNAYVVTYWKLPEEIDIAWTRYAYRICIDAEIGEYIGMN